MSLSKEKVESKGEIYLLAREQHQKKKKKNSYTETLPRAMNEYHTTGTLVSCYKNLQLSYFLSFCLVTALALNFFCLFVCFFLRTVF